MKKKGTTESYSALIGIIIAFLMLTAIGCAVYNMYKPKGVNYFNKLADQLRNLEQAGDGEGELSLFLEKDQFIVGFNKDQEAFDYSPNCPSNFVEGWLDWGCYGVQFLKPKDAVTTLAIPSWLLAANVEKRPMKILKPKKCAADKTCLCLCKMDNLKWMPYGISEKTCTEQTAICTSFDVIEFTGGEECCEGAFIPGTQGMEEKERGLRVVQYKKVGNRISLSDLLFQGGLEKAIEGERQKIVQLQEYLKTKRSIYFIPVNWDKDIREFDRAVTVHYDYTEKKIKALEKKTDELILNKLSDNFNVVNLKNYQQCKGLNLDAEIKEVREKLKGCLTKADPGVTEEILKESKMVGLTDDEVCGYTDIVDVVISKYDSPKTTAHEWGHLMLFCDEYKYEEWKWQNELFKSINRECMNPYPVCCKDHPYWTSNPKVYKEYLEEEKIGPNCFPHYQDLSDKAKERFKTKEEYEKYIDKYNVCHGHICKSENPKYKYCRGIMGPSISCENKDLIYDNSLDYSYLDFDRLEDFEAADSLKKQQISTTAEQNKPSEEQVISGKTCPLPATYDEWIKKYSEENKIPPSFLKALIKKESSFEPLAVSISGSTGLLQFAYSTGQGYFGKDNIVLCCKVEKDETIYNSCKYEAKDRNAKWDSTDAYYCNPETDKRFNPETSIKAGAEHLGDMYNSYSKTMISSGETIKFALAAYNQGVGCINYAMSEFAKTGSDLYTWDEVSDYIPNTKPCHSTARADVKNYVSKILEYEKEYSTCFV